MAVTEQHSQRMSNRGSYERRGLPSSKSEHRWCRWCGDDLPKAHPITHCNLECFDEDIKAAERNCEPGLAKGLKERRRLAVKALAELAVAMLAATKP